MPDRTKPPIIQDIQSFQLPEVVHYQLDNGLPVYALDLGTQEVVKLEVAFFAGRPYERKRLAARATARQIREGSDRYSASEVAEALDFYGCSLSIPFQLDTSHFILYSMNKHFREALPLLKSLLQAPAFPESELQAFIKRNQRRLSVDLTKNDVLAYRELTARLFGESHPYGYNSEPATYAALKRGDLQDHHRRLYNSQNCAIFLSGRISQELLDQVNEAFSEAMPEGEAAQADCPFEQQPPQSLFFHRPDTVQSAIRIGCSLFNRHHPDYMGMYVLNTILGGYFGSRLMANVREDKGYTYNIYSSVDAMLHGGSFLLGTEVSKEFVADSLRQIYAEMERLQEELVGEEELSMVRNYLLGSFLTMLDGPFNISEVVRTQVLEGLPMDYLEQLAESVRHISAEEIRSLAQQYLKREKMWEVVVGP